MKNLRRKPTRETRPKVCVAGGNLFRRQHNRRGVAYVLSLLFLTLMSAMAMGMLSGVNVAIQRPRNHRIGLNAELAAESGVSYFRYLLEQVTVPGSVVGEDFIGAVGQQLANSLDGTAVIGYGSVSYDVDSVTVPEIQLDDSRSFQGVLGLSENSVLRLTVTGRYELPDGSDTIVRVVSLDLEKVTKNASFFDHGLILNGPFSMNGNCRIMGVNSPEEAHILTTTDRTSAIGITGNCDIEGGMSLENSSGEIGLRGNNMIGGNLYPSETITNATIQADPERYTPFQIGLDEVEFPTIDPSVYESFATNIVDSSTPTSGGRTFTNIRIKAGTNPTFSGNTLIEGVVFIETPNKVKFSGNVTLRAVVVTQDATGASTVSNHLDMTGNMNVRPLDELPDTPEFAGIKALPGSFLLAPGFKVSFMGNVGTIGGCMAAEMFDFRGNVGGTIHGPIISYGESTFSLRGNVSVNFDRSDSPDVPPGFVLPASLRAMSGTYTEH